MAQNPDLGPASYALNSKPVNLETDQQTQASSIRSDTGLRELNRVLGGGLLKGSFILLGGEPGIGKSTLLLQMAGGLAGTGHKVLYISAEESVGQCTDRAHRLGVKNSNIRMGAQNSLKEILDLTKAEKPDVLIVDSIQTVFLSDLTSAPGSVSQVRECAGHLMTFAKGSSIPVILVGHVTKDGSLAGPKVLEHLVDTVLSFEGDRNHQYRLLRAMKNRFGPTHELGVFQMESRGLIEVDNPSEMFLEERAEEPIGSAVFAAMEGSRPLLCEVQALVAPTHLAMPRRTSIGIDVNRVHLLCAVLDRHAGTDLARADVFVNVVGGLQLEEPAADLAVAAALISSARGLPLKLQTCFFGELGLTGEARAVPFCENRIREGLNLGFKNFVLPKSCKKNLQMNLEESKLTWLSRVEDLESALASAPRGQHRYIPDQPLSDF